MDISTLLSRGQFAFTIGYHYLFPQLTMGLALLILLLKTLYLWRKDERYNTAARFWAKIFAITFVMGVVTGIPMEFQFGTNWARFSVFAGDIIARGVRTINVAVLSSTTRWKRYQVGAEILRSCASGLIARSSSTWEVKNAGWRLKMPRCVRMRLRSE